MVSEKGQVEQLADVKVLAVTVVNEQGIDSAAKTNFMSRAVVEFPLVSAGDLVGAWDAAVGLPAQPPPTQENTASSASHHPAE
jgi:hypothetical protein